MAPKPYPHVLIVGAGLSGLTLAQVLRKNNVSYEIFERDPDADARSQGWAIALHGPVLRDLKEYMPEDIGPIEQTNHLTPLDERLGLKAQFVFYNHDKPDFRLGVNDDEEGQIVRANRQRLRDYLRKFIPVQFDRKVVKVEEGEDKVTVHFENGTSASGDIVVGAEGTRSVIRKHILHGKDVLGGLPVGSLVGEVELTGEDFKRQLELGHSAYIVMTGVDQCSMFAALNRVSEDGKIGYWYFILHWVDEAAAKSTAEKPFWTMTATKEELQEFALRNVEKCHPRLREIVDKVPLEGYRTPGIVLLSAELNKDLLPPGRVMVIGDAAHSMTPFRGEAGVAALQDAVNLGRALTQINEAQLKGAEFTEAITKFRDDMLARGARAIAVSNPVLEQRARDPNHKWVTCGKEVKPLPAESIPL